MTTVMGRWLVLLAIALGTALWPPTAVAARSSYDGTWSVSIITEEGTCDRAYRYRVQIIDGRLHYDDPNGPPITISGQVAPNGRVNVSVRRGDQQANGSGRLSGNSGTGVWRGRSSSQQCSGRWDAERRG